MIYTLFIYEKESGLMIYNINFQDINSEKVALFSSFFGAINAFVSQLMLRGAKNLKNIQLGDYIVIISPISQLNVDLVIIADFTDEEIITGLLPKFKEVILTHGDLFLNNKGDLNAFKVLDAPISEIITARKKESLKIEAKKKSDDFLTAIYSKIDQKTEEEFHYTHERLLLLLDYNKTNNILKKISIGKRIIELSDKLNDEAMKIEFQNKVKELESGLENSKIKLRYYLEETKKAIHEVKNSLVNRPLKEGNFRDAYMNLYSFSSKLKQITSSEKYKKYKKLATSLIEKEEISENEFAKIINTILNLSEKIEDYLNEETLEHSLP
ncbi:MAG: hypothetical protein ACTSXH_15785 [Promethearchaeota archaeon]